MKRSLQFNEKKRPGSWDDIKYWRDIHEVSAVSTSFGIFDADNKAETRLQNSIEHFDVLPTIDNNTLVWKTNDNQFVPLTKTELEQVYSEVKTNRAKRSALLHEMAEVFNEQATKPTPEELSKINFWLET